MIAMFLVTAPTLNQIHAAAEWLCQGAPPNPDLEYVLNLILMGRLPQDQGELLAIAHTAAAPETLAPNDILGVLMAGPDNKRVSLAGCDGASGPVFDHCTTTQYLLSLVLSIRQKLLKVL